MIFVRDKGRLCNNLLQYGHVYAWGREHGRKTMSMRFAYKYQFFHVCHTRWHWFVVYALAKFAARRGWMPVVSFDNPGADYSREEQLMLTSRFIMVQGWMARWYDLFLKYKSEILQLFAFDRKVMCGPDRLLASLPKAQVRLGLHIRRGDYRTWWDGKYYYNDEQYIGVLRQFLALHQGEKVQVFICGNDPELHQQTFVKTFPEVEFIFPDGSPGEDLYLLSRMDWLIGAPSTFTLVASMYRDVPLYWIEHPDDKLTADSFGRFDRLFQEIR